MADKKQRRKTFAEQKKAYTVSTVVLSRSVYTGRDKATVEIFFCYQQFFLLFFSHITQNSIQNITKLNNRHIFNISRSNQKSVPSTHQCCPGDGSETPALAHHGWIGHTCGSFARGQISRVRLDERETNLRNAEN